MSRQRKREAADHLLRHGIQPEGALGRSHNLRLAIRDRLVCQCRHDLNFHVNVPERGGCMACECMRFRFKLYLGSPRRSRAYRELERAPAPARARLAELLAERPDIAARKFTARQIFTPC